MAATRRQAPINGPFQDAVAAAACDAVGKAIDAAIEDVARRYGCAVEDVRLYMARSISGGPPSPNAIDLVTRTH